MPFIPERDADAEGPVAWPGPQSPVEEFRNPLDHPVDPAEAVRNLKKKISGERRMTLKDFINISISMAGAQIAWTLELGYGTPFLRELGLAEQLTSLVWLAGPISGLIAQPLIGAISDSSTSAYRRRYWIWAATVALSVATVTLAYVEPISSFLVTLFSSIEDWNPDRRHLVSKTAIGISILCFYVLDFALNALQASLRNLLLDLTPAEQLATGNAWHGRMTHAGSIIGYTLGAQKLDSWGILRPFGEGQFRRICMVSMVMLIVTVTITCLTQHEVEREPGISSRGGLRTVINNISNAIWDLPKPIRRVCFVQVFAFMGWFPFLFYSTAWVGQIMAQELDSEPTIADATRAGYVALLVFSVVSVTAGTILPYLSARDSRLLRQRLDGDVDDEDEDEDEELSHIRAMVRSWKGDAARMGKPLRLPAMPFMLRNIWTIGLLLFGILMSCTIFVRTVWQATVLVGCVGLSWAIACWVPFAIIMEFLKEVDAAARQPPAPGGVSIGRPVHTRVASSPAIWRSMQSNDINERTTLLRRNSLRVNYETDTGEVPKPMAGGTVLGIHNLAIVFPQFIVAIVASLIFKVVDAAIDANPTGADTVYYGRSGVGWVLRFGGISAFIGAIFSRQVPPTRTEKDMRRRLAEMKETEDTVTP